MSTINTTTLQADTLVAQNGNPEKVVSIPSIEHNLAFAKITLTDNNGFANLGSSNISSVEKVNNGIYHVTFMVEPPTENYVIAGTVNGGQYFIGGSQTKDKTGFDFQITKCIDATPANPAWASVVVFTVDEPQGT